jgi:hypothetical protein
MPNAETYGKYLKDPTSGMSFQELLDNYATFGIKSPYETIRIPTSWLIDPRLTNRQKIVLLVLNAYSDSNGHTTISKRQIQIYTHGDRAGTIRALEALANLGYIERIDGVNGKRPTYQMLDPTPKPKKSSGQRKNKKSDPKNQKQG